MLDQCWWVFSWWITSSFFFCLLSPEPIPALERQDKKVFLLDTCSPEQPMGIQLGSIQEVISQVLKRHAFCGLFCLWKCSFFVWQKGRPHRCWTDIVTHCFFLSVHQDRHCLLELGMSSVEGLLRQGIYPIVIHIRPKNKKRKKLRWVQMF